MQNTAHSKHSRNTLVLAFAALGVVFGDIGTSPLYALRECFSEAHNLPLSPENVIGVLSLIFWTIMILICAKYMAVVMKADNKGEGGILALMALASSGEAKSSTTRRFVIITLGLFGAALLYGDGVITPAISVLSAVEGLYLLTPAFEHYVIPLTIFILNAFFLMQKFGTGRIGVVFGPILLLWFFVLGALGLHGILQNPAVLEAINPYHAIEFFQINGFHGFVVMGSVVLVVTGGEALYADMGHFGRRPIRLAWFFVAMPGLVLNYFGQGALLLSNPEAISNPFYLLAPKWGLAPLVILATMATVIASQALVSGIFSITRQAVQLGFCPRLATIHTSSREIGQIYLPFVNWALFVGVIWLVVTFKSSSNLAAAYGIAVTGTMVITTILAFEVSVHRWHWGLGKALAIFGGFLIVDLAFFGSNIMKVAHGGWVPLVMAAVIYLLMITWHKGRKILYARLKERSVSIEEFCQMILRQPPLRVSGTAIYMAGDPSGIPVPLLHNLKHNKVLHERVAILTIQTKDEPFVPKKDRVLIQEIIPNLYRIIVYYGFMETPKMKHILEACRQRDIHFNVSETTFVLGRETILPSTAPGMSLWREKLFAIMSKNAQRPTAFFKIPPNQVIEVGIQVEI
ncbi:potassium transporter Kup [Bdellovibrio sp. HCB337]|uniref:potassium transporter Kup n=1 Tax=Bdellovibrio sp. HCB337 TaxID=3394358 RepID=UPI0039A78080